MRTTPEHPSQDPRSIEAHNLLATKLHVPRIRDDNLSRPRLVEMLEDGLRHEVILVCTPAGFGKTTLLGSWAAITDQPVAWLTLDADDNDPARFWRYVIAAVDNAGAGTTDQVLPLVAPSSLASGQAIVMALVNAMTEEVEDFVLVLDDYHSIESSTIHEAVSHLLAHLPPRLRVILSTRADPPLPIPRLRARGRLAELRADDLRLTLDETKDLLRSRSFELSAGAVAKLSERTEGWAAGLQLAALGMRGRPDPEAMVLDFAGTHRFVLDYLTLEVLNGLPETTRTFLLDCSILDRLCGPLCDALCQAERGGQELLEELERSNVFLVALDDERRWYRFHHLFRDVLRGELTSSRPASIPDLHRRAGAWHEANGLMDEAIRHANAAGDLAWSARLIDGCVNEHLRLGENKTLEGWLSPIPDEVLYEHQRLLMMRVLLDGHRYRVDEVQRLLEIADKLAAVEEPTGEPSIPTDGGLVARLSTAVELMRAQMANVRRDADATERHATRALQELTQSESSARFWARSLLNWADWTKGHMADAEARFAELLAESRATAQAHPLTRSSYPLVSSQVKQGKLGAAYRTCRESLEFAQQTPAGARALFQCEAHLGMSLVHYHRNQLDDASKHVSTAVELSTQIVDTVLRGIALSTSAWIRRANGDRDGALAAMDEAHRILPNTVVSLVHPGPVEIARFHLAMGDPQEAERWLEGRELSEDQSITYAVEQDYLLFARILMHRRQYSRAIRVLEKLADLSERQGRIRTLIEVKALWAMSTHSNGDRDSSRELLEQALALAQPEGFLQIFVDEGQPMASLVQHLVRRAARDGGAETTPPVREHLNRLIAAFRHHEQVSPAELSAGAIVDPLTKRELDVLRLVAGGLTNQEVADELIVSIDTVKKHVSHVLDKLASANRTEAVTVARDLGLVD